MPVTGSDAQAGRGRAPFFLVASTCREMLDLANICRCADSVVQGGTEAWLSDVGDDVGESLSLNPKTLSADVGFFSASQHNHSRNLYSVPADLSA